MIYSSKIFSIRNQTRAKALTRQNHCSPIVSDIQSARATHTHTHIPTHKHAPSNEPNRHESPTMNDYAVGRAHHLFYQVLSRYRLIYGILQHIFMGLEAIIDRQEECIYWFTATTHDFGHRIR